MRRDHSFRRLRRSMLARMCALVLVLLAITPWTAPFATVDTGTLTFQFHDDASVDSKAKDSSVVGDSIGPVMLDVADRLVEPSTIASQLGARNRRTPVLRI